MTKAQKENNAVESVVSVETMEIVNNNIPTEKGIVNFNAESLISQAITQKLPVDVMERLLAMRKELKAEWAKEQYTKAMSAFQSQCPTIQKTKEVKTNTGEIAYKYAPIESIVEQIKEPLQRNGFSYSTNMELLETGVKVFVKVTHISGHSEVTEMNVPLGNKTLIMSQTQVVAAAQTFAKRYAFCNAFGILTGDEDTDARPQNFTPKPTQVNPKPTQNDLYLNLSARINDVATLAGLDMIGAECREVFNNKKISLQDLNFLSKESMKKRAELTK